MNTCTTLNGGRTSPFRTVLNGEVLPPFSVVQIGDSVVRNLSNQERLSRPLDLALLWRNY